MSPLATGYPGNLDVMIQPFSDWMCGAMLGSQLVGTPTSAAWTSNNRAFYMPLYVPQPVVVVKLWVLNGATASGNIDLGLYTRGAGGPASLLTSSGSTAQSGTSVVQEVDITDQVLSPGTYYVALAHSSTVGTVYRTQIGNAAKAQSTGICMQASALPLPATATPVVTTVSDIPIFGVSLRTLVA